MAQQLVAWAAVLALEVVVGKMVRRTSLCSQGAIRWACAPPMDEWVQDSQLIELEHQLRRKQVRVVGECALLFPGRCDLRLKTSWLA